jgi:hypothetical protein
MKTYSDTIGNRTRVLPACSAVPQPTALQKSNNYYVFLVCICSRRYPACSALAPFCHLCPDALCNIFPLYLIKDKIFKKKTAYRFCLMGEKKEQENK